MQWLFLFTKDALDLKLTLSVTIRGVKQVV